MDERLRFVARLLEGENLAAMCREFDISRKTGYKIFSRFKDFGLEGLTDRSRRPYRHANRVPFQIEATIVQLMLLTGCRCNEWAAARTSWIDMDEALMVIPATAYKSNHVDVVPLVPAAYEILQAIPKPQKGDYLLSSTQGLVPMQGVSKYFNTRLPDAIMALTGTKFPKKFTSHDLRRTVATRLAESLGDEGDKLVRRVLGHSDGSVTAIYNRYGYVREMRRALEQWANDLTSTHMSSHSSAPALSRDVGLIGARAALA